MKVRVRATASVSTRAQTVTHTKPQCSAVLVAGSSSTNRKKAEGLRPREGAIAAVENLSPAHARFKFDDALKTNCCSMERVTRARIRRVCRCSALRTVRVRAHRRDAPFVNNPAVVRRVAWNAR
jgi:hypothetical protein